ncbi:hypothetical protein MKX03_003721, partial [Papaver bracteatum]
WQVSTRLSDDELTIIFMLGDTVQAHKYDQFCHLSVGDLLRLEQEPGSNHGEENRVAFYSDLKFVLYLSCSLEVMVQPFLHRKQKRVEGFGETIKKRVEGFGETSLRVFKEITQLF